VRNKNLAVIASVAVLAAFAPHARPAPARWALIVGISDYVNFGSEIGGDLPGARPDALAFRDVLVARYGFTDSNIHLVLDREATRDRIITELKTWLPSVAKPGDLVVFFYAGHGSQAWDTNGDEEDGLDETICPTDVLKGNPNKDIPDDELNALLNAIPSDHVVVTLDNCHAGSGTRAVTPFARPRSLSRVASADLPKPAAATSGKPVNSSAAASERLANKILEISAAGADEVAVDAEWPGEGGAPARVGGAFTTNFVRNLWQAPTGASYQDIFQMTVEDMKRDRFAQRPGISRADQQAAFVPFGESAKGIANEAAVPVLGATAAGVQLGGGAAAGMTVGSVYTSGAASLRVTAVEATRATATASGGSVKAGDRAKLSAYKFPTPELRVSVSDLAPANRTAIGAALSKIAGVRVVDTRQQFAHLLIRPAERAGYNIIGMDGAIRHSVTTTDPAAIASIISRESGAHQLAELENPARPFSLEFGFASDKSAFRVGDEIQFHAVSSRDGYLTIVDLGTDGKIAVLYPTDQKDNRVKAGQRITLPPPAAGVRFVAQDPVGRGIVRAFLTERPLALPATELDAAQAGQVVDALRNAVGGSGAAAALPVTNWATTSVVYTVTK
jgi:hypothetical protein